jgi:hypothetical protein
MLVMIRNKNITSLETGYSSKHLDSSYGYVSFRKCYFYKEFVKLNISFLIKYFKINKTAELNKGFTPEFIATVISFIILTTLYLYSIYYMLKDIRCTIGYLTSRVKKNIKEILSCILCCKCYKHYNDKAKKSESIKEYEVNNLQY